MYFGKPGNNKSEEMKKTQTSQRAVAEIMDPRIIC